MTHPAPATLQPRQRRRQPAMRWKDLARDVKRSMAEGFIGVREFSRKTGIDKAAVSRVRNGHPIDTANFMWICGECDLDPWAYFR